MIRRFHIERDADPTGVSGTGFVAEGIEFSDGTVAIHWLGDSPSTVVWRSIADAYKVHGHNGATRFIFLDRVVLCGRTHGGDDDEWACDAPAGHADGCPPPTGRAARHAGVSTPA